MNSDALRNSLQQTDKIKWKAAFCLAKWLITPMIAMEHWLVSMIFHIGITYTYMPVLLCTLVLNECVFIVMFKGVVVAYTMLTENCPSLN